MGQGGNCHAPHVIIKVVENVASDLGVRSGGGHELEERGTEVGDIFGGEVGGKVEEAAVALEEMLELVGGAERKLFGTQGEEDVVTRLFVDVADTGVGERLRNGTIVELAKKSHDMKREGGRTRTELPYEMTTPSLMLMLMSPSATSRPLMS